MRSIKTDPELQHLFERVCYHAKRFGRTLPEMRFFILEPLEFASLLEKNVYPTSPVNIWEGRDMVHKRHRIESGQESALYYEVVQTGNPSYAYLNSTNSAMMQASVMAHVVGHCEFSELNVLKDSNPDRTEKVMYLVKKVNYARTQMGNLHYKAYWNAAESLTSLVYPHSQYNLKNSVEWENVMSSSKHVGESIKSEEPYFLPYSSTLSSLFLGDSAERRIEKDIHKRSKQQTLNRQGYHLKAPCQDIFGFIHEHAKASEAERTVLDYMYTVRSPQDFIIRTQIMNEGWAMYWEKKIMMELFKEKAVRGIIDYSKVFSGVCFPRPFFMRNPYHLGFHLWTYIEKLYREGKVSLDYKEEVEMSKRMDWKGKGVDDPISAMSHLVRTITDYEFLRRFLSYELIEEFYLNRIDKRSAGQLAMEREIVVRENKQYVWIEPKVVKKEMLSFFTHFHRPRIYLIHTDYKEGGLLLFHRNDNHELRKDWIKPTLKNLNMIWKGPIGLISRDTLYHYGSGLYKENDVQEISFDQVLERMKKGLTPAPI